MAHSALVIPVPELDFLVRPRLERRSPELLPQSLDDTAAHVTLLRPFAELAAVDDGLVSELTSFFADVLPFAFQLSAVSQSPGGLTYLAPEPAGPFRQLTFELVRRFPEFPPYGGEIDEVVPHLTVPMPEGEDLDKLLFELEPRLPVTAYAREAALHWFEPHRSHTIETFPFGTAAA